MWKIVAPAAFLALVVLAACNGPIATSTPTPPTATPTRLSILTERATPQVACEAGETTTVFQAGEKDNFDPDPDTPPAVPGQGLTPPGGFFDGFDSTGTIQWFAHTFTGLPENITSAWLEIPVKPGGINDSIGLNFQKSPSYSGSRWIAYIGTYPPNPDIVGILPDPWDLGHYPQGHTFIFDLSDLPPQGFGASIFNLVPDMNKEHLIDVFVYGLTGVDYLTLAVCSTPGGAPPAPDLAITKSQPHFMPYGGGAGTYSIVVQNQGNATASSPIRVVDTLPVGFTFLSTTTPGWTCVVTQPVADPATDQQIVECIRAVGLGPGGTLTLIMEVTSDLLLREPPGLNCAKIQHPDDVFSPNNESCTESSFLVSAEALAAPPPTYPACQPASPRTTFMVGEQDGFDPDPDTPPASPGPGLIYFASNFGVEGFDAFNTAAYFAHTFKNLPADIRGAWLAIRLKPGYNPFNNPEDIHLDTTGQLRPYGWISGEMLQGLVQSPWDQSNYPQGHTILLDLSALTPSPDPALSSDLIPGIRYSRRLDILIRGNSAVDYLTLTVCITLGLTSTPPPTPLTIATRAPAPTSAPIAQPTPTPSPTPTATPTPTPTPTRTPTPTSTPEATDLTLDKFANLPFQFGRQASYTFRVGNVGRGTARSPIAVVDDLPNGITFDSYSDPYSTNWACSASGQRVTCTYTGPPDISPGGFLPTLIIYVRIVSVEQFPATAGAVQNCARVHHPNDVNPGNDQGCVSTVVTSPGAAG